MITQEEFDEFTEACKDAVTCPRLTDWETQFMEDHKNRLEQYGLQTWMSDSQKYHLRRIAETKIYV